MGFQLTLAFTVVPDKAMINGGKQIFGLDDS